jgi:hypothetical protein
MTPLERKLRECLAWVEDNGGSLVFEGGGTVALFDEEGDTCGQVDGFRIERAAEVLDELLEDARTPAPAPALPMIPDIAIEWFGLGESRFAWDERRTISATPDRAFQPDRLLLPGGCAGYLLHQMRFGGVPILTDERGIPAELFSELVGASPQILFPAIGPDRSVEFDLRAPSCPPAPRAFSGAFQGHKLERLK